MAGGGTCAINEIDPAELFRRYEEVGFVYPAKRRVLAPYLPNVLANWYAGMAGGDSVLRVVTWSGPGGAWASTAGWRSTHSGWNYQHTVSTGGGVGTRAVLLAEQAAHIRASTAAAQVWFQRSNRYANGLFGAIDTVLGPQRASVVDSAYLAMPLASRIGAVDGVTVFPVHSRGAGLAELAGRTRGRVFVTAEELDQDDLLLDAVDETYRGLGLRRYRRIWLATIAGRSAPVGAAVAWRGPLGFNFSFLENRCDLLVDPTLPGDQAGAVAQTLIKFAMSAYEDFPAPWMPLVVAPRDMPFCQSMGAQLIRLYAQAAWLAPAYTTMYAHWSGSPSSRSECADVPYRPLPDGRSTRGPATRR